MSTYANRLEYFARMKCLGMVRFNLSIQVKISIKIAWQSTYLKKKKKKKKRKGETDASDCFLVHFHKIF